MLGMFIVKYFRAHGIENHLIRLEQHDPGINARRLLMLGKSICFSSCKMTPQSRIGNELPMFHHRFPSLHCSWCSQFENLRKVATDKYVQVQEENLLVFVLLKSTQLRKNTQEAAVPVLLEQSLRHPFVYVTHFLALPSGSCQCFNVCVRDIICMQKQERQYLSCTTFDGKLAETFSHDQSAQEVLVAFCTIQKRCICMSRGGCVCAGERLGYLD
mmetsp:Transcript_31515/g.75180  ORF Transcript_31515/g.75180 Transcript_31515/m.75180 type:complete len:215 (-) Transcript_31515:158-802(-)